jgi:hypothetical protein
MTDNGLFPKNYEEFLKKRDHGQGPNFEEVPLLSVVPPVVSFREKLRWWSLDRWKRREAIRQARDQRLMDIVQLKRSNQQ